LNLHRQQVGRVESRIDGEHALEAAQQQARAYRQHDGERDLGDDECAASPFSTSDAAPQVLLQFWWRVVAELVQRRNDTDDEADQRGKAECTREHRAIHGDSAPASGRKSG
jgi:hypothetical protein